VTNLLAVTTQQKVGLAIAIVAIVAWVFYIFTTTHRSAEPGSEIELAPNRRPYLQDDAMEGPRLDRALMWALVFLGVLAIGLPLYWLREPSREAGAERGFDKRAIERGHDLFTPAPPPSDPGSRKPHFGCSTCHGPEGQGGATTYSLPGTNPPKQVQWQCPPLNTVLLRYHQETDPTKLNQEVRNIITYGRQNTPMPAWGLAGGGPMNDQQISDLIAYLGSIQLTPEQAQAEAAPLGTNGKAIFDGFCARCHTQGFTYGEPGVEGGGAFGPNLTNGDTLRQFPDPSLQIQWVTQTADYGKQYGVRGVSHGIMPHFGDLLTPEQIKAVVDYERSL
jgi:mono/diheme cytochrome c family protein